MKINIQYILLFFMALSVFSCVNEDIPVYNQTDVTRNDPYSDLLVNTPVVSFVAGEPGYDIEFLVITPGSDAVSNVNVYKTFTDAASGAMSATVLLKTYAIAAGNSAKIQDNITYADLKDGITINGSPLTDVQSEIPVGSSWVLSFEPVDGSNTEVFATGKSITVGVLSPFAGFYTVIDSDYWRIGVQSGSADWTGETRFIGSVDANTFSHVDGWGPFHPGFGPAVGHFEFDLNDDNSITIPDTPEQLFFSGDVMLTCQEDAAALVNVPCDGSNVLEPKADGKHIIKLTYGYHTNNSGDREFYEVLEKIVE